MSRVDKENPTSLWWALDSLTSRDANLSQYMIAKSAGVLEAAGRPQGRASSRLDPRVWPWLRTPTQKALVLEMFVWRLPPRGLHLTLCS